MNARCLSRNQRMMYGQIDVRQRLAVRENVRSAVLQEVLEVRRRQEHRENLRPDGGVQ